MLITVDRVVDMRFSGIRGKKLGLINAPESIRLGMGYMIKYT